MFSDIKGQERAFNLLDKYLRGRQVPSALLFTGPKGVGKKKSAFSLAKALNCEDNPGLGCTSCVSCVKIDRSLHPDIHFFTDETGAIKIEDIRKLQRQITLKPYEARAKVFIIDNAHKMGPEASNAILKILEEPPEHSHIILISDKPFLLFKTVISRCQIVKFGALGRDKLKNILKERYQLSEKISHYAAYFSEGRPQTAQEMAKDDLIEQKNRIIDCFVLGNDQAFEELSAKDRDEAALSLQVMAGWIRDLYLHKAGTPAQKLINFDREADIERLSGLFSIQELEAMIDALSDSLLYLQDNVNVRLVLTNLRASLWKKR
jgi:DNA polymerase-3 subunit delta'